MSLTGESVVVAVIVGAALFVTLRRAWRAVRSARVARSGTGAGCDAGCGCDSGTAASSRDWAES